MTTRLVAPPAVEPVTLLQAKAYLNVGDMTDDDALITNLISQAREHIEAELVGYVGSAMLTQTWDQWWDAFPSGAAPLVLDRGPLQSLTWLKYTDSTGNVTTLTSGTDYVVDLNSNPPRIAPAYGKQWPTATLQPLAAVNARSVDGFTDVPSVPWQLKQMILFVLGHWYPNRAAVEVGARAAAVPVPRSLEDLLAKFKAPMLA